MSERVYCKAHLACISQGIAPSKKINKLILLLHRNGLKFSSYLLKDHYYNAGKEFVIITGSSDWS